MVRVSEHPYKFAGIFFCDVFSDFVGESEHLIGDASQFRALGASAVATTVGRFHRDHVGVWIFSEKLVDVLLAEF